MRITIDIDGKDRNETTLRMLMSYFNLSHVFPNRKIEVEITKHGYHLICYTNCKDVSNMKVERELRRIFGDCSFRVDIDEMKERIGAKNFGVLWTEKEGFKTRVIKPF